MKKVIRYIIPKLKKIIDKWYYNEYTYSNETLIREMFPGVNNVGEYNILNIFFKNNGPQQIDEIVKILGAYYWGEVERLTLEGKFSDIIRYQGILDFTQSLRDYQQYILTENNNL